MKAEDLYEAMQYIRSAFVEESEMKIPNQGKKLPRRILLIAAAVAALGIAGELVLTQRGAGRRQSARTDSRMDRVPDSRRDGPDRSPGGASAGIPAG